MQVSGLCYAAMAQAQLGNVAGYSEQLSEETWANQHLLSGGGSQLPRSSSKQNLLKTPHRKPRPFAEPLAAENCSSSHTVMYVRTARRDCYRGFTFHTGCCGHKQVLSSLCGIHA